MIKCTFILFCLSLVARAQPDPMDFSYGKITFCIGHDSDSSYYSFNKLSESIHVHKSNFNHVDTVSALSTDYKTVQITQTVTNHNTIYAFHLLNSEKQDVYIYIFISLVLRTKKT